MLDWTMILMIAPPILMALIIHEFSHAYVANKLGDPTAKDAGRLTLNPLAHLDLMGTIMAFIIHIGWAKPVPVNPSNFKNPRKDMLWVSLAGPTSNVLLALIFGIVYRIFQSSIHTLNSNILELIHSMLGFAVLINLILAFFNIIPLPPLDGSNILLGLVPRKYDRQMAVFQRYGQLVLFALVIINLIFDIPLFYYLYMPFVRALSYLFAGEIFI